MVQLFVDERGYFIVQQFQGCKKRLAGLVSMDTRFGLVYKIMLSRLQGSSLLRRRSVIRL